MQCPYCGHEIPTTNYIQPHNGPHSFFMPIDTTGCASAAPVVISGSGNYQSTICAAGAAGDGPVNITFLARGIIGGE